MNILVLVPFKEEHMDRIREAAGPSATVEQLVIKNPKPFDTTLKDALMRADIVIGEPPLKLLYGEGIPVKWVQMTWAGTDVYTDTVQGFPEGMVLTNVAGEAYGHVMSQYVVGQILAITQNLGMYARQQLTTTWADLGENYSLEGANVLIYGAGDIGQCVAKRLSGFDCARITGVCRDVARPRPHFDDLVTLQRAELLLPESDVVVGCIPNSAQTKRYFNNRRLRLIKPGGVLVNVGRGNFVDNEALNVVLSEGLLRGAALDVTDPEPLPRNHPLWRNPRCLITPHISGGAFGHSEGTEERICAICCENLRRYAAGEDLVHRV